MEVRIVKRHRSYLPEGDDHPYRTGAWRPNLVEYDATALELISGEVPRDLAGVYLRNTENPLFPALERYHPFDGDGMLHSVQFEAGSASYRNRLIPTEGLKAELAAERPLFAGILESPSQSEGGGGGWGARTGMKDASSTDVVVHAGRALTSFYQCGDLYACDPRTLEPLGREQFVAEAFGGWGVSAHTKLDSAREELLLFSYSKAAPHLRYAVIDAARKLVHQADVPLPGPRLPHDLAFSDNYVIFNDFPLFWDPELLTRGVHHPRLFQEVPTRFGVLGRRAPGSDVRWFEAAPTYALHFSNAFEQGDELVLDGYAQRNPAPARQPGDGPYAMLMRYIDLHSLGARLYRWRFNLKTGETREEELSEAVSEFPSINPRYAGRPYRYVFSMTSKPGWFLFNGLLKQDLNTGRAEHYAFPEGVYASESPFAARAGGSAEAAEDDGYLLTLVTDLNSDSSECQVFDAQAISRGPIARLRLPERISSGTHACFSPLG